MLKNSKNVKIIYKGKIKTKIKIIYKGKIKTKITKLFIKEK
jgi:hypothetical protein